MTTLVPKVKLPGTGSINRSSSDKLNEIVSAADFGDITVDIGVCVNAAYTAGHRSVSIPAGTYPLLTTIAISADQCLFGAGITATFLQKNADVVAVSISNNGQGTVDGFAISSAIADTTDGLVSNGGGGYYINNVAVNSVGGNGFNHIQGNRTQYGHIVSTNNGGHGFYCDGVDANTNACKIDWIDARSNTLDGINLGQPYAENWVVDGVCQANGNYGFYSDTTNGVFNIYSESNGAGAIILGTLSRGCFLKSLLSSVVDNGLYNIVLADLNTKGTQGIYSQRVKSQTVTDGVSAGQFVSNQTGTRAMQTTCSGTGSSTWTLQHESNPTSYSFNIQLYGNMYARNGFTVSTPDGTKRYTIAVDNAGAITSTLV